MLNQSEQEDAAALEARIAARSRALRQEAEAFKRGGAERSAEDIQSDIFDFFEEVVPLLPSTGIAALALIDVAPLCIQMASAGKNWLAIAQAGAALTAAVMTIRQKVEGIDDQMERELGSFLGAHMDQSLYAFTQLSRVCEIGILCDMLLEGGFLGRQAIQVAGPEAKQVWDWATGILANGGASLSDDELRTKLADGAWLSKRQSVDLDPEAAMATMLAWVNDVFDVLATVPSLADVAQGRDQDAVWAAVLKSVDKARQLPAEMRLMFAASAGCVTPLAAYESGRDIVYLVGGITGGATIRYFGGGDYRKMPEALQLPDASLQLVKEVADLLGDVEKCAADDLTERSTRIDYVRDLVGRSVFEPILERWPDAEKLTFVAVGWMNRIPISATRINGRNLNTLVDVTLAPNAGTILVAGNARPETKRCTARVMADPAEGEINLPWVVEEAIQVAAVYGKSPDLIVNYPVTSDANSSTSIRSALTATPAINITSEHVLSQIEDARVVHLACHGYVPLENGLPGLLLYGCLTFDALEHHRFAEGATIVLSACSVGRSIREAPLAQLGFPAMFLSAGASEVVASTQPLLDCQQTVDFMVSLHRHLRDGANAAEALASATQDAERQGVPSAVWGSFEVYGAPPTCEIDR